MPPSGLLRRSLRHDQVASLPSEHHRFRMVTPQFRSRGEHQDFRHPLGRKQVKNRNCTIRLARSSSTLPEERRIPGHTEFFAVPNEGVHEK